MSDEPNHEGIDFALEHLCAFLGVDPHMVSWDAATETVDGDVSAVIGNIMRAKYGEDFDPKASVAATVADPTVTTLTPEAHAKFIDACENPAPPTQALIDLMRDYGTKTPAATPARDATEAMALAGARSIGNTIHTDNHGVRARECWRAMWDARDGIVEPIPQGTLVSRPEPAATPAYPSITAMTAAVELEIKSALGFATTQAIGQMIQKAMDAVAAAAATPASEAADWQYRFRDPHNGAPWGPWKRMMGSIEENRALFAGRIIGESDRDETKMAVEFRPLYPHSRPMHSPTET